MNIRVKLNGFLPGNDVVVIVKCPDIEGHTAGKYLVGRHCMERMIVAFVFDATAPSIQSSRSTIAWSR